jgi:sarcosine oxidase
MTGRTRVTRRAVLSGIARGVAAASLAAAARAQMTSASMRWDTVIVGAGVFGAWTAWHLRRAGQRVLLLDAWGPAHARASSGGESRMTRTAYGADEIYARMAWESLPDWKWLSSRAGLPVFHETGVLFFFPGMQTYVTQTIEAHKRLKLPTQTLDRRQMAKRWPQIGWDDIEIGLYEPELGVLMARRAVQTLVQEFIRAGGEFRLAAVKPPGEGPRLESLETTSGETLQAERFVFACGPWLPKVLPQVLGQRIFPTRQEVLFFAPPEGDARFAPPQLPGWADFNDGDLFYGMPDLEGRGFKIAHDRHGARFDPDAGDRILSAAGLATAREFMRKRFPALASRPLTEARVCQYENSSNGDLLIDLHPVWRNVVLVGAGSGHGFKHGPAVGRYAAGLAADALRQVEPRFSLASKATAQDRAVH